jgi:hypothetical protein
LPGKKEKKRKHVRAPSAMPPCSAVPPTPNWLKKKKENRRKRRRKHVGGRRRRSLLVVLDRRLQITEQEKEFLKKEGKKGGAGVKEREKKEIRANKHRQRITRHIPWKRKQKKET